MPHAVVAWLGGIGLSALGVFGVTSIGLGFAAAIGGSLLALTVVGMRRSMTLKQPNETVASGSAKVMTRATDGPRVIVYGETTVRSLPTFVNTTSTELRQLFYELIHTGHEIDSFRGWWIDDKYVPVADVDTAGDGSVDANTGGHGFGPVSSVPVLYLRGHLGTSTQAVDSMLDSGFTEIGTNHRHRGCSKTVVRCDMLSGAEAVWDGRAPQNIIPVIRGKKVYDPRLDSTFSGSWGTGSGAHRVNDPTTWAWSRNNALCWADAHIDADLGPGMASSRINYNSVAIAADACDVLVDIPGATTEKRFQLDAEFDTSMEPQEIIDVILASMAGHQRNYNGQFYVYAGVYQAPDFTLNESDLIGPLDYRKEPEVSDRYNRVSGTFFDRDRRYKSNQFITVNDTTLRSSRDNGRILTKELELRGVSGEYQAQRLGFRAIGQAGNTGVLIFPCGYQAANRRSGDTCEVTLAELGFVSKVFRVVGIEHVDFQGFTLTLKEDTSAAYADPSAGSYGTRSAAGTITFPGTGTAAQVVLGMRGLTFDGAFSATDADTVAWASGTLRIDGGVNTYSVSSGNTGNMTARTFIFFDVNVSTTVLQTTTTAANAIGAGRVLIAVAEDSVISAGAFFQVFIGAGGASITSAELALEAASANVVSEDASDVELATTFGGDYGTVGTASFVVPSGETWRLSVEFTVTFLVGTSAGNPAGNFIIRENSSQVQELKGFNVTMASLIVTHSWTHVVSLGAGTQVFDIQGRCTSGACTKLHAVVKITGLKR